MALVGFGMFCFSIALGKKNSIIKNQLFDKDIILKQVEHIEEKNDPDIHVLRHSSETIE